jgi:OMF family outer membrane factor
VKPYVLMACVCVLAAALLAAALPVAAQAPGPAPAPSPPPASERPVTLAQAVTQALQNNLALRLAAFEVQITRAQLEAAQGAKAGTIRGSAAYTRTNERATTIVIPAGTFPGQLTPITITIPSSPNLFTASIVYEYPLYTGGRLEAQIALATAGVRGVEAALERTKQDVILATKRAYFQVLGAQAALDAAQRSVASAEETLRIAQARVRAGTSPRFDEIQAEVSLAQARQGVVRARNGVAVATQELAAMMALPVDTLLRPQESMDVVPVATPVAVLVAHGFAQRPELGENKARMDAAAAAIELAKAGARPVVGLVGAVSSDGTSLSTITLGWSLMLSATFPIFDGGVTAAKIKEAELRLESLKVVEAQLRQRIELEVRQSAANLAAAAEEVAAATKTIEQAREALRIAQVRFREGVGTNLEVIAAQAALAQAEAALVQALLAFNTARAQLERAVGGPV